MTWTFQCTKRKRIIRLIGFEELGNDDAFDTAALELRLSMCGTHKSPNSGMKQPLIILAHRRDTKDDTWKYSADCIYDIISEPAPTE